MLNFETKVRVQSEKFEGVAFTVRRLSKIQRDNLTLAAIDDQIEISALGEKMQAKYPPGYVERVTEIQRINRQRVIDGEDPLPVEKLPPEIGAEVDRIDAKIGVIMGAKLKPLYVRAGLVKVEGIQFDGRPATADLLIENGPDELVEEIWLAINAHAKLTVEQQGNSQSATPSSEVAHVAESNSIAPPASV